MVSKIFAVITLVLNLAPSSYAQSSNDQNCVNILIAAAVERTKHSVQYDGSYRQISYPGGDVPDNVGVCTDLIIRSYRQLDVDLQQEVHEDMTRAFSDYPRAWGLSKPDPNIDHRRVENLRVFLGRHGVMLPVNDDPHDYLPGDLVTWVLPGNLSHIGIVSDRKSGDGVRPLIVHNIGRGPEIEDMLFDYAITGHYRYEPCPQGSAPSD
jgi:uncharacterized protein YijF (DUF1287 family)